MAIGKSDDEENKGVVMIEEERLKENFTQIPNAILRHAHLSPGAKLTYTMLRMYAFSRGSCFPGQARLAEDPGTSVRSVIRYVQELKNVGLIRVKRQGLGKPNVYYLLRWNASGSAGLADQKAPKKAIPEMPKTGIEEHPREEHEEEEDRSNIRAATRYDEDRRVILEYVEDFAREFNDRATLKQSTSRAHNLFRRSGRRLDDFLEGMEQARAITKERSASIRSQTTSEGQAFPTRRKMAYFFQVLEGIVC